jgi:hypothetical protein
MVFFLLKLTGQERFFMQNNNSCEIASSCQSLAASFKYQLLALKLSA